jgi:hypothetical protein
VTTGATGREGTALNGWLDKPMYDLVLDYNSLLNDVMITNATYLGIGVAIILGSGIAFYFINLKPFQDEISKATDELRRLSSENSNLISDNIKLKEEIRKISVSTKRTVSKHLLQLENRFGELEGQISSSEDVLRNNIRISDERFSDLEKKISREAMKLKWDHEWSEHYLWDTKGVHINTFISLVTSYKYASKLQDNNKVELCIQSIHTWLNEHNDNFKNDDTFKKYKSDLLISIKEFGKDDKTHLQVIGIIEK